MRLKRIILENFQSHRYTEITLAPTVTVLVGESDQGKSAVVRALRWLFYNRPHGADFVRVGADTCRVTAEFEDGLVISRERQGKTNRYVVRRPGQPPQFFEGFGREVPPEVAALTGVRPLKLEGANFELHIAHQLDPPFLLKESPAVRARAVGHLSGTEFFDAADRKAARALSDVSRLRRDLEERIAVLKTHLAAFDDLPELEARLERCAANLTCSEKAREKAARLTALREEWESRRAELAEAVHLLAVLPESKELEDKGEAVTVKVSCYLRVRALREKWGETLCRLASVRKVLTVTTTVPVAEERLVQLGELLARLARLRALGEERRYTLNRLKHLEKGLAQLASVSLAGEVWERAAAQIAVIFKLRELRRSYVATQADSVTQTKRFEEARLEVGRKARQFAALLEKARRCPLCLAPLSAERVGEILRRELGEES